MPAFLLLPLDTKQALLVIETTPQDRNTRLGLRLFLFYALFYLAFVMVNAFAPTVGEWQTVGGLNLAVLWGFVLIGLAFVMAMLYGWLCSRQPGGKA